jgi:hypothetical protein
MCIVAYILIVDRQVRPSNICRSYEATFVKQQILQFRMAVWSMETTDKIVSDFIMNTCNLDPQPSLNRLLTWFCHTFEIPVFVTGSISEMYIEPMLPCVRDIDIMYNFSRFLAVHSRQQVPRCLPPTFEDALVVSEIVETNFPGYVYLLNVGVLLKRFDADEYNFMMFPEADILQYCEHIHKSPSLDAGNRKIHGPAINIHQSPILQQVGLQQFDTVVSIRCLEWPTQAADWTTRHRNYNWPDTSTIDCIVHNGCDLVEVAHHQCRQDEWMRTRQWRLSFSRAETVLLNSWTPVQQIVYHILRFIIHESGLSEMRDNNGYKLLSRYHLKTLMMWTCELNQSNWWVHSNVIQLSRNMLQQLMSCCKSSHCRGYFVSSSNILECNVSHSLISLLTIFTELTHMTDWIVRRYISECVKQCSQLKHWKFDAIVGDSELRTILNSFVDNRSYHSLLSSFRHTEQAFFLICRTFRPRKYTSTLDVKIAENWYEELRHIDQRLLTVFVAMFCLSQTTTRDVCAIHMTNLMSATLTKFDKTLVTIDTETTARCLLLKAIRLIEISVQQSTADPTTSSILLILSHIHLRRLLQIADCDSGVFRKLANVYLAVLYFVTEHHKLTAHHCKQIVTRRDTRHVIGDFRLPKINDDIDNVLGLVALYEYCRENAIKSQSSVRLRGNVFTVQFLAHYLLFLTRSASVSCDDKLRNALVKRYRLRLLHTSKIFSTDFLLFYLVTKKWSLTENDKRYIKTSSLSLKFDSTQLRQLLILLSVEQLTVFLQIMSSDYHPVCKIVSSDIQATYAYLSGQYELCLRKSQKSVNSLWHQTHFLQVPIDGCMTQLMNDDVAAIQVLVRLLLGNSTQYTTVCQLTLALYFFVETERKLKFPMELLIKDLRRVRQLHSRLASKLVSTCDHLLLSFIYRKVITKLISAESRNI